MKLPEIAEAVRASITAYARMRNLMLPDDFAKVCANNAAQSLVVVVQDVRLAEELLDEVEKFCPVELQDRIRRWRKERT